MLNRIVNDLKGAYAPYLEETASILLPLMSYPLSDESRMAAMTCVPAMLESAVE